MEFYLEMGYYYLRFYTAESRPGGEHLLKISGIFHIFHTSYKTHETGKNCPKIFILVIDLIFVAIFNA